MTIESIGEVAALLAEESISPRTLHRIWEQRRPILEPKAAAKEEKGAVQIPWLQGDPGLVLKFARRALEAEEFLMVCDLAHEVERLPRMSDQPYPPGLFEIRMMHARALAHLGSTDEARSLLEGAGKQSPLEFQAEVFSLLGDVVREESHLIPGRAARIETLKEALSFYVRARSLNPQRIDIVIMAAAIARLMGDDDAAVRDAKATLELAAHQETRGITFETASARAAAFAVLGRLDEAAAVYETLKDTPDQTTGRLAEARFRAQILAEAAHQHRDFFKPAFPPLQLLLFAGHMPSPDPRGRFPLSRVTEAREAIRKKLAELDARAGLGSAAAGGDLLFVDELLNRGASVDLVLPWAREEYRKTSVLAVPDAPDPEPGWNALFEKALDQALSIRELGQLYQPRDVTGWKYMSEVSCGLALLASRVTRLDLQPIVLWDGHDGPSGGTASFARFWERHLGQRPIVVDVPGRSDRPYELFDSGTGARTEFGMNRPEVKSMLFADIVGYSRMAEQVIPEFITVCLGHIAQLVANSRHAPISVNTWGDAVYAVFDYAVDAGCFALELVQMIKELEPTWLQMGLYWEEALPDGGKRKQPLNLRVGLHTGPVFLHYDPVVRGLRYTGAHVNRAARIEPVARPGEVYASEEFAALAALDKRIAGEKEEGGDLQRGFRCDYAGTMALAKGYPGRYRIYRVLPNRTLNLEALAQTIHREYCETERARGITASQNGALVPWRELPEDLKEANRAQAADIPNKLRLMGYEIAPLHGIKPGELKLTAEQLERASRREHDRWMAERRRQGWVYGPVRDNARKHHPQIVLWEELTEEEREKDRNAVRNALVLAGQAGFELRPIAG